MKVYNTLTKSKELFETQNGKVKMYVCGPTVYDYLHIGNARPYVVFDTVRRYLEYKGYDVTYVQNFTDIDDKIITKANSEGVSTASIAEKFIAEAKHDALNLNVKPATINPLATAEIDSMIQLIEGLIKRDCAYEKSGTVYFDTSKAANYGQLSGKNIADLISGNRVEIDNNKRMQTDFVLWKPHKPGEPKWSSPWGDGRPGWHTECSAIIKKYLGDTIDIHAGGEDLIFPHHENELIQSEMCNGKQFVKYWLHNGFINVDNEKMSKSKNNFFTIREIADKFSYDVIRFFILNVHYRSPINFSDELLQSASTALERIRTCIFNIEFILGKLVVQTEHADVKMFMERFEACMDDDFNTAGAIGVLFDLVRYANTITNSSCDLETATAIRDSILKMCEVLGIRIERNGNADEYVQKLIDERVLAKANKNWIAADKIRNQLSELGIVLEDTTNGTRWFRR